MTSDEHTLPFRDKCVVVTGASSGIGEEIARHFGRQGARVILGGRNVERLSSVARAIRSDGAQCAIADVDLCSHKGPSAVVSTAIAEFGAIDVLVHSAGVYRPGPILQTPLDVFDETYKINVRAAFALAQASIEYMPPGSAIIFVGSISGHVGFFGESAYAASKAAIDGLTKALAIELSPLGIRVNCVAPGFIASPMNEATRSMRPDIVNAALDATLAGRLGDVEDIATAVLYIASPQARHIHGITLAVDGGYPVATIQRGSDRPEG